jgi:hypothetical protein
MPKVNEAAHATASGAPVARATMGSGMRNVTRTAIKIGRAGRMRAAIKAPRIVPSTWAAKKAAPRAPVVGLRNQGRQDADRRAARGYNDGELRHHDPQPLAREERLRPCPEVR